MDNGYFDKYYLLICIDNYYIHDGLHCYGANVRHSRHAWGIFFFMKLVLKIG
jgi:hypothetical protein